MKQIPLTRGKFALVDDEDYAWLASFKWCAMHGYAGRRIRKGDGRLSTQSMHRLIMNAPSGLQVDHRNLNTLDNRRSNLRLATKQQNDCNRSKQRNNTSGFKGVSQRKESGKWRAFISLHGRKHMLGTFDTREEASEAYATASNQKHGEFACV